MDASQWNDTDMDGYGDNADGTNPVLVLLRLETAPQAYWAAQIPMEIHGMMSQIDSLLMKPNGLTMIPTVLEIT